MKNKDEIQKEALEELKKHNRGAAAISMGVGKTKLGLMHMLSKFTDYSKFLLVAHNLSIFQSWKDDAKKFGYEYLLDHVSFSTYISLHKQDTDYDGIYLDECHSLTDTSESYLDSHKGFIIGLTGTYPKRGDKFKMLSKFCPVRYSYVVDDAVADKILNDYEVKIHLLPLDTKTNLKVKSKFGFFMSSESKQYNFWNQKLQKETNPKSQKFLRIMRMKTLMSFESKERYVRKLLSDTTNKCIVFANTQEQADKLCNYSYHSSNTESEENLRLFKEGKISKLSCVHQLSEGITIPDLKEAIIMHSYGGTSAKTHQRLGRTLRLSVDQKSTIHILCYEGTADEKWVNDAIANLDPTKIKKIKVSQLSLNI